jgi:hypothetical protein
MSGPLTGIVVRITNIASSGSRDYTLQVFDGAGFGGTLLYDHNFTDMLASEVATLPVSGVTLTTGQQYTWAIYATGVTSQVYLSESNFSATYDGGGKYYSFNLSDAGALSGATNDMYFQTLVTWTPVYTWDNGVTDNVAFTPTSTETYTVTMIDANRCKVEENIEVEYCGMTSVTSKTQEKSALTVYPNPAAGIVTISTPYAGGAVRIYNEIG